MRLNLCLLCCAGFPLWAANTQTAGVIQVVSVNVASGPMARAAAASKECLVEIVVSNLSPKSITAYSYTVNATYADGSHKTSRSMQDAISYLIADAIAPTLSLPVVSQQFGPGQTRTISISVPLAADGSVPVSFNAEIPTIALDDGSALGDKNDIADIEAGRKRLIDMISLQLADLKVVQAGSPWQSRAQELVAEFTAAASTNQEFANRAHFIKMVIAFSAQNPLVVDQDVAALTAFLAKLESFVNRTAR